MTITARDLLARFAVYGRYIERELDGQSYPLRSHLEIFERDIGWPQARVAEASLVAIMMNPGGSRPLAELDSEGWAPAMPDRTQYQLMRLALRAQDLGKPIRHIRVINLSDLRTPKSAMLFDLLGRLGDATHSIFSVERAGELGRALGDQRVPVLRAWGLSPHLLPWCRRAVEATRERRVLGLTCDGSGYRHPLPQRADLQMRWLEDMTLQLAAI